MTDKKYTVLSEEERRIFHADLATIMHSDDFVFEAVKGMIADRQYLLDKKNGLVVIHEDGKVQHPDAQGS